MTKNITIGKHTIGADQPPFFIAEISANHNGSLERALEIVDAMADAGAHAIKLQTYTAHTMTLDLNHGEFIVNDPHSPWKGRQFYGLYEEAYTPWEWHKPIFERARKHGMEAFSSPFDFTATDFLDELAVPAFKVASFENTDLPLIKRVASKGKPMIISCGMAKLAEIDEAVRTAREAGCEDLILLKCTSAYPAEPTDTHLATIPHMRTLFNTQVGLSDHTLGIGCAVASVSLGATVIEKHVTLKRSDGGVDSSFSMEPQEVAQLVQETKTAWQALGHVQYGPTDVETNYTIYRRSLYVTKDIEAGESFSPENLRVIRPGLGLEPKYYEQVLGRKATTPLKRGTAIQWEMVG